VDAAKEDDADGNLKVLVNLVNTHGPRGVINVLNRLVEAKDAEVTVSTCHKAKGSEWSSVAIAGDFAPGDAKGPIGEEAGKLAYVAVTRAQHVLDRGPLAYIDGK
jgi:superfamily I DNA/RNA helicase